MSLLRKIFSGSTPDEERASAEKLLEEGDPGSAKLRFEKALAKTPKSDTEGRSAIEFRIAHCCDEIARRRLAEAKDLIDSGQLDLAEDEIHGALEVAHDESLRTQLHAMLEQSDRSRLVGGPREDMAPPAPASLYALMRSAEPTEEDQAFEYDSYGPAFHEALEATFRGEAESAVTEFEKLLKDAADPRYLHYELGLAYRLAERGSKAQEHFVTFLSRIAPDEGGVARIQAHAAIANHQLEQGHTDAAIEEMQKAVEALPHSPAAYYELGNLLRRCGHPNEAVDVLRAALDLDGGDHWMMRQALGLALLDAGEPKAARSELEQVVAIFIEREDLRLPTEATVALAELCESDGEHTKAADLYRMLCDSTRVEEERARFHLRAGELLAKADKTDAANTMLKRAQVLAEEYDLPEIRSAAEQAQAGLANG